MRHKNTSHSQGDFFANGYFDETLVGNKNKQQIISTFILNEKYHKKK